MESCAYSKRSILSARKVVLSQSLQFPGGQLREMKLQHFMHKHPLIINEFPGNSISFDEQVEDLPNCKTSLMDFPVNQKQVAAELERRNRMAELERINEMERMERINEMKELMEGMERQERELMKWRKRMEGLERMEPLKGMERDRKDNFYEESIKAFVDKYK
nr:hypothetical protein CFP56_47257 [Quercus suber]